MKLHLVCGIDSASERNRFLEVTEMGNSLFSLLVKGVKGLVLGALLSDHDKLTMHGHDSFLYIKMSDFFPIFQPISLRLNIVKFEGYRQQECSCELLSFL
jgi:hypothetical protein